MGERARAESACMYIHAVDIYIHIPIQYLSKCLQDKSVPSITVGEGVSWRT